MKKIAIIIIISILIISLIKEGIKYIEQSHIVISPLADPIISPIPEPEPRPLVKSISSRRGIASFYSLKGCVGCRSDRLMANGVPLDDSKLTVAYNYGKLNKFVVIKNLKTGKSVQAQVTDRGGFERLGRIIDLSVATKNAINCTHLCEVEVISL